MPRNYGTKNTEEIQDMAISQKGEDKMGYWLELDATSFSHSHGKWFGISLLAFATRDHKPLHREPIQFFAIGNPLNDPVNAEKGRALKEDAPIEIEPGTQKILVEAHILNTDKRAKKLITVPWPEEPTQEQLELKKVKVKTELARAKKELGEIAKRQSPLKRELEKAKLRIEIAKLSSQEEELEKLSVPRPPGVLPPPESLRVTFSGERGKQKLIISVAAADGALIPSFTGIIQDGDTVNQFKTEANGVTIYQTNFSQSSRLFEVRAGNTEKLIWKARLLGRP